MTQLRKIGGVWINPRNIESVEDTEDGRTIIVSIGSARTVNAELRRVLYILTMRDPRRHCDPLPDWMEWPELEDTDDPPGQSPGEKGALDRRRALAIRDEEYPGKEYGVGVDAQNRIAIDFYDAHVIGYEEWGAP